MEDRSVYESSGGMMRYGKKSFDSCFKDDVIVEFYNAYLPLV